LRRNRVEIEELLALAILDLLNFSVAERYCKPGEIT